MVQFSDASYQDIVLRNIQADAESLKDGSLKEAIFSAPAGTTNIRAKVPALTDFQLFLEKDCGFFHADRMLKCTINLKRLKIDLDKNIRLEVKQTRDFKEDIRRIALKSFPVDRRFNVDVELNSETAGKIINTWVDEIDECYVCFYKDIPVGFAQVVVSEPGVGEIKLAAVDADYRMTGAAVSLYSYAIKAASQMEGVNKLVGWISSVNCAVMNLYASLGASFSDPEDIFVKECK
ncbi:MAG: GNAT family N-acetyltransferase [Clostridiales bacterium]|nr:GNAT family N-acetyltransferase [Clostridiales bacterium]